MTKRPARWVLGDASVWRPDDAVVSLTLAEHLEAVRRGLLSVPFHDAVAGAAEPAPQVHVAPPRWRGYSFAAAVEWLVCSKLAVPESSEVEWAADRRGGATGVRRLLTERGWTLLETRDGPLRRFKGPAPPPGPEPIPRSFRDRLGGAELTFAADWGAFSGDRIDDGTRLLFEAASELGPQSVVADIGTGYGPLAVGLLANGLAERVVASDIDSPSLALAETNVAAHGAGTSLVFSADPGSLGPTPLTVCNFPTHAGREDAQELLDALVRRSRDGVLLMVVHGSLERAFIEKVSQRSNKPTVVARRTHSVIRCG
ncbi:MAG TPA: methyltransferase [Actinomycetota bacterium]|nr:methyltransferase [Actinomycetota bacterium]